MITHSSNSTTDRDNFELRYEQHYSISSRRVDFVESYSEITSAQLREGSDYAKEECARHGGKCLYCSEKVLVNIDGENKLLANAEFDHIFPLSQFNPLVKGNGAISCKKCNNLKSDKHYSTLNLSEESLKRISKLKEVYKENFPVLAKFVDVSKDWDKTMYVEAFENFQIHYFRSEKMGDIIFGGEISRFQRNYLDRMGNEQKKPKFKKVFAELNMLGIDIDQLVLKEKVNPLDIYAYLTLDVFKVSSRLQKHTSGKWKNNILDFFLSLPDELVPVLAKNELQGVLGGLELKSIKNFVKDNIKSNLFKLAEHVPERKFLIEKMFKVQNSIFLRKDIGNREQMLNFLLYFRYVPKIADFLTKVSNPGFVDLKRHLGINIESTSGLTKQKLRSWAQSEEIKDYVSFRDVLAFLSPVEYLNSKDAAIECYRFYFDDNIYSHRNTLESYKKTGNAKYTGSSVKLQEIDEIFQSNRKLGILEKYNF